MSRVRPYIVRQGDYVAKVATEVGCTEDEIWEHEKNRSLRDEGRTKDMLAPGDVLYVPASPTGGGEVQIEAGNNFRGVTRKATVKLVFRVNGKPRSNERCKVTIVGAPSERGTDAEGALSLEVPVTTRFIGVVFEDPYEEYRVAVGDLDPASERSGEIQRMQQLGYLPNDVPINMISQGDLDEARERYRAVCGLEASEDDTDEIRRRLGRDSKGGQ